MILFARLFIELDERSRPTEQSAPLERYFEAAPAEDAAWALHLLIGAKTPRALKNNQLREWIATVADLPPWLVDESCETVGDIAETLALLLPDPTIVPSDCSLTLHRLMTERLLPLGNLGEEAQRDLVVATWRELDATQRFIWNKLITGSFRIGVSRTQVARSLGKVAGVSAAVMAHRILGFREPTEAAFRALFVAESSSENFLPYPFQTAREINDPERSGELPAENLDLFSRLDKPPPTGPTINCPAELGDASDWQAEWLAGGLRVQVIRRGDAVLLWSQEEELLTAEFPEIADAAKSLPDGTVLDGDLVVWPEGKARPESRTALEQRLAHGAPTASIQRKLPVVFLARDILEAGGGDQMVRPLHTRCRQLNEILASAADRHRETQATKPTSGSTDGSQMDLFAGPTTESHQHDQFRLRASSPISFISWEQLALFRSEARDHGAGDLILRRQESRCGDSDITGDWWIWRMDPLLINAVLIAALPSQGNSSRAFSDYTFAIWSGDELVPIAKTGTGLQAGGFQALDDFIRGNIIGKFGPVRSVKPELVFELEFDFVQTSTRHKSGLFVRSARIRRRRPDLRAAEADTLDALRLLARPTSS